MLDINFIRQNPDGVRSGIEKKGFSPSLVDDFLAADDAWRNVTARLDDLRNEQNFLAKKLAGGRGSEDVEFAKRLKEETQRLGLEQKTAEQKRQEILYNIPNLPAEDALYGKSDKENVELRKVGEIRDFEKEGFRPKDHLEIAESLDIVDFQRGAKVSGSGFYYLKNDGVLLELALVRYALDVLRGSGFEVWFTPDMAKDRFYLGTGYLPKGDEAQTYVIENSDLGMIATAEVTLAGLHADEVMKPTDLPKMYAGYSHCFRQEAGAYGKYSKGLYRVHQFTKVEMFAYTTPEESVAMHQKLLKLEEEIWRGLGVPYRVLEMCTGDLGSQAVKKYDLEAWMPGRNDWGEITSTSNTTDYQSRRLNIRYKKNDGGLEFVHTLNGTAIATSRAIVAILENFQKKDGSVLVPEVLEKYMGKSVIGR